MSKSNVAGQLATQVFIDEIFQECYASEALNMLNDAEAKIKSEQVIAYVDQKGDEWDATVLMCEKGQQCQFWKKCMAKRCHSEIEAKIVLEYGKSVAQINQSELGVLISLDNFNLN